LEVSLDDRGEQGAVHIATADDDGDLFPQFSHPTMQQSGDSHGSAAFDDEVMLLHRKRYASGDL
jgi:hypothetical protein